jgi:hypothetical protein
MTAALRSRLFRNAMLAIAVLFSQTANAAKPVRQDSAATPPASIRLCAAWPESRNDFKATIQKAQRPKATAAAHTLFSAAGFLPAGAAGLQTSQQIAVALNRQQLIYVAQQFRSYALRV